MSLASAHRRSGHLPGHLTGGGRAADTSRSVGNTTDCARARRAPGATTRAADGGSRFGNLPERVAPIVRRRTVSARGVVNEWKQVPPASDRSSKEPRTAAGHLRYRGGAGRDLRSERLHQVGHAVPAPEAGLQVPDGHDRALQAARSDRGRRGRRGHEGLGDGEGRHPLRPRLLPPDPPHRGEARQLPGAGRRRVVHRRVRGQDVDPGRA